MGTLNYSQWTIEFDDRVLTHLQIVIVNRFRRGEALLVSWIDSAAVGDGRSSIWMSPAIPVYFKFAGSRPPSIDEDWLRRLDASAGSSTGLVVMDERGVPLRTGIPGRSNSAPRSAAVPRSVA